VRSEVNGRSGGFIRSILRLSVLENSFDISTRRAMDTVFVFFDSYTAQVGFIKAGASDFSVARFALTSVGTRASDDAESKTRANVELFAVVDFDTERCGLLAELNFKFSGSVEFVAFAARASEGTGAGHLTSSKVLRGTRGGSVEAVVDSITGEDTITLVAFFASTRVSTRASLGADGRGVAGSGETVIDFFTDETITLVADGTSTGVVAVTEIGADSVGTARFEDAAIGQSARGGTIAFIAFFASTRESARGSLLTNSISVTGG